MKFKVYYKANDIVHIKNPILKKYEFKVDTSNLLYNGRDHIHETVILTSSDTFTDIAQNEFNHLKYPFIASTYEQDGKIVKKIRFTKYKYDYISRFIKRSTPKTRTVESKYNIDDIIVYSHNMWKINKIYFYQTQSTFGDETVNNESVYYDAGEFVDGKFSIYRNIYTLREAYIQDNQEELKIEFSKRYLSSKIKNL